MASSLVFLRFLMARLLLWMLLCSAKEAAVSNNNNNCRLFLNKSSPWAQCQCLQDGLGDSETVRLSCADVDWERMPDVRTLWEEPTRKEGGGQLRLEQQSQMSRPSLAALCIRNGRIRSLEQDAFRTEAAIQSLELSLNAIESVNANAFRGLEGQLTQLDLSGNRLTLIPGWALTYLRQLQKLQLEDNRIARIVPDSFGETHLANLRYVHLERNRIETLGNGSLARLPAQVLMLAGNRITKLESGSLPQAVWFLDLKDNLLENIPFAALDGLGQLKVLDLERNNISELAAPDLGQPPLLETAELDLKLAHNRIRVLAEGAFDGFRRFARLDLSHNQIGSISEKAFRSVQTLSSLDLGANSLVQIPQNTLLRFANSLLLLNLNNNNLAQLPDALGPLLGLRQLNLDGNQLKVLDESLLKGIKANLSELSVARNGLEKVPSQALQGMTSLRSLDLSRNAIVRLGKMAFGSSNGLGTNGVSALQRLSLAGNRIRELTEPGTFLYLGQLTHLDLSHNQIQRVSKATLERLESLESLSLDHNEMLEFPRNALSSLAHLRQLSMEANRLAMLPNYAFQWLVHLQKLNLASNRLHTLNAKTFHSTSAIQIKWLSLAKNRISRMETAAFQNLPNLEQLFLHFNQLKVLQTQIISSLKNLRHLTLAHNQINETQENAFANLPQLQSLSLAHNRLRTIKEGVFHKVSALAILDLSYNRIEAFDLDFMGASAHQIRVLDISHNVIRKLQVQPSMGSLRVLHLQQNQLEFVDGQMLRGFEQLRSVDLSQNDLIELSEGALVGSIRLERIILADNNLRHIWKDSFRDQLLIRLLDLSGNVLHSLEPGVFGQNNLLELDLSRNNFSAIPIRALDSVRESLCQLKMTRNGLTRLDRRDFEGLSNLSRLELAENRIESLEEEVFSLLPRLKWLDLSGNPVSSWSPHVFLGLSHSLTHLDISRCSLFSLPRLKAPSLLSLNLSGNFLYELSATDLDPSPGLISLDLSRNRLGELRAQLLERMPELRVLNVSDNGISSLGVEHFRALGQLEVLSLARLPSLVRLPLAPAWALLNRLRSLELHSLGGLAQLLDVGPILHFLPPLHSLHFESRHEIFTGSELAKADLRLLRHLTISGHSIRHLDPNAFARLRGFRLELTLAGTQLRHFPPEALANLQGVAFLRLSLPNNRIQWLAPFWQGGQRAPALNQRGTMLESLDLRGNPLECDCRMRWLAAWLARAEPPEAELLRASQCSVARGKQPSGRAGTGSLNLLDWAQRLAEEEADDLDGCGPAGQLQRDGASRVHKSATFLPFIGVLLVADWLRRWRLSRTMR